VTPAARISIATCFYGHNQCCTNNLRALIESIMDQIPRPQYDKILVVDDCSPDQSAQTYLSTIERYPGVEVIRLGEARMPFYNQQGRGSWTQEDGSQSTVSFGHGEALNTAVEHLKGSRDQYLLVLDSDCVVLDGSVLQDVTTQVLDHPMLPANVLMIGEYFGFGRVHGQRRPGTLYIVDKELETEYGEDCNRWTSRRQHLLHHRPKINLGESWRYGMVHLSCGLIRADIFSLPGVERFRNDRWIHTKTCESMFAAGHRAAFFPFYRNKYIFHLGYGTLGHTKAGKDPRTDPYGNHGRDRQDYAKKAEKDYYAGYLQLRVPSDDYDSALQDFFSKPAAGRSVSALVDSMIEEP
jgi:glycosyltransferase involved in cell wall biosynthesis